jgi:hypothetical protein
LKQIPYYVLRTFFFSLEIPRLPLRQRRNIKGIHFFALKSEQNLFFFYSYICCAFYFLLPSAKLKETKANGKRERENRLGGVVEEKY